MLCVEGEEGGGAAITPVMHLFFLSRLWHLRCEGVGFLGLLHLILESEVEVLNGCGALL